MKKELVSPKLQKSASTKVFKLLSSKTKQSQLAEIPEGAFQTMPIKPSNSTANPLLQTKTVFFTLDEHKAVSVIKKPNVGAKSRNL